MPGAYPPRDVATERDLADPMGETKDTELAATSAHAARGVWNDALSPIADG